MLGPDGIPRIDLLFDHAQDSVCYAFYERNVRAILSKIFPEDFFRRMEQSNLAQAKCADRIRRYLPIMSGSPMREPPSTISFYLLATLRCKTCRFFFEMITSWLVPGTSLNNVLFFAADFRLPDFGGSQVYTVCEMTMRVEDAFQLEQLRRNLPILETEILAGVRSAYHARKILESKGWSADQKTAEIHERIAYLVRRLPNDFDNDVFTEMQHVLVMCPDEFKAERDCRHLGRIISVFYLYRKTLLERILNQPNRRHILLKIYRYPPESGTLTDYRRLAIIFSVNFLQEKELLEERHVLGALRKLFPGVKLVEGSFLSHRRGVENVATVYLEVDIPSKFGLTIRDMKRLEEQLPKAIKDRIEHPMNPVFNPRNEEEIMRNILVLGNQIKYIRDIPQLHLSFDEQTHSHLFFTVVLVRVLRKGSVPIRDMFKKSESPLDYIHERSRRIGMLRRKYPKEATVFRIRLEKHNFLREDHSIDLFKARQFVVSEVAQVVGEIRDYNGGMIAKQNELLDSVRSLLREEGQINSFLLENFFYSLTPVIMRSVMEPGALKTLYQLLVHSLEYELGASSESQLFFHEDSEFLYAVFTSNDESELENIEVAVHSLDVAPTSLAAASLTFHDRPGKGWIYRSDSVQRRLAFINCLQQIVEPDLPSKSGKIAQFEV